MSVLKEPETPAAVEEMLALLPDRIIVGPYPVRIRKIRTDDHGTRVRVWGQFDCISHEIQLNLHFPSLTFMGTTFLHELFHAIWWAQGLGTGEEEERAVDLLSMGLMQVYRDNPWLGGWIERCFRFDREQVLQYALGASQKPAKARKRKSATKAPRKRKAAVTASEAR